MDPSLGSRCRRSATVCAVALVFSWVVAPLPVMAVTLTAPSQVIVRVGGTCMSAVAGTMNFGTLTMTTSTTLRVAAATASATLTINCTNAVPYSIVSDSGQNTDLSQQRRMRLGTSSYLRYDLYTGADFGTPYPTSGTSESGTGTGANQSIIIYGAIPSQTVVVAGLYQDTLTLTVTY
jgi:spore coat protein U-like protein